MSQVFDQEIRLFRDLQALKSGISLDANNHLVCLIKALRQIDTKHRDGLDCNAIRSFLNKNVENFEFSPKDVQAIFRRLRLDPQRVASFYQVCQALFPAEERKPALTE